MRYLGGKTRIANDLVGAMRIKPGCIVYEPFCGGLSVTTALARAGARGVASDACVSLIALYQAVLEGWDPPASASKNDHKNALLLPDSDPRKAFLRFGCGFGGNWSSGFAERDDRNDYCRQTANSLKKSLSAISDRISIMCLDFLREEPTECDVVYCDPPYQGTQGYSAVGAFDHDMFWVQARQWSLSGCRVYVSEYEAPSDFECVWYKQHSNFMGYSAKQKTRNKTTSIERLFAPIGQDTPCT